MTLINQLLSAILQLVAGKLIKFQKKQRKATLRRYQPRLRSITDRRSSTAELRTTRKAGTRGNSSSRPILIPDSRKPTPPPAKRTRKACTHCGGALKALWAPAACSFNRHIHFAVFS